MVLTGIVHFEVVFSMLLLYLSSKKELHFTTSAWPGENCGHLCYYFRNNLGIGQPNLQNLQYHSQNSILISQISSWMMWKFMISSTHALDGDVASPPINKAEALRTQLHTDYSPAGKPSASTISPHGFIRDFFGHLAEISVCWFQCRKSDEREERGNLLCEYPGFRLSSRPR